MKLMPVRIMTVEITQNPFYEYLQERNTFMNNLNMSLIVVLAALIVTHIVIA